MKSDDKLVRRALDHIQSAAGKPYLPLPIPNALDGAVSKLVDGFAAGQESERRGLLTLLNPKTKAIVRCYSERMASFGARTESRKDLLRGLIALTMAGFGEDPRDNLPIVALHYAAALKVGVDVGKLFEEAASFSLDPAIAQELRAFPRRPEEDKSLEAMGV
ncbi:MAG: hypothetical protein IPK82_40955 [Polyangiaceae bacterium]|nr:hypothetical protein [Polyangiaceae bacterium]